MISSSSTLLSSSVAPLSKTFMKMLKRKLHEMNITVIHDEKVVCPNEIDFGQKKFERNATVKTVGKKNMTIETDLLVWAATWNCEHALYPMSWQNEISELNISDTFQLVDRPDVFAIGDISSVAETKQAITLGPKMQYITHNVLAIADAYKSGKDLAKIRHLKHYHVAEKATMYLPLGPDKGVSQFNGWTFGDNRTSKWKGKDLYTDLFWRQLTGHAAPSIPTKADIRRANDKT